MGQISWLSKWVIFPDGRKRVSTKCQSLGTRLGPFCWRCILFLSGEGAVEGDISGSDPMGPPRVPICYQLIISPAFAPMPLYTPSQIQIQVINLHISIIQKSQVPQCSNYDIWPQNLPLIPVCSLIVPSMPCCSLRSEASSASLHSVSQRPLG